MPASGERILPNLNLMAREKTHDHLSTMQISFLHEDRQTIFSRRDMLAATAVGGVVTAATMTTADAAATPVKSDISFGNPNDPPQVRSTPRIQGALAIPVRRIRP
jgi:hypothetical protein